MDGFCFIREGNPVPYKSVSDLPSDVRKALPTGAQSIWLGAFNGAFKSTKDEGKAASTAWATVKLKYKKDERGEWVAKSTESDELSEGELLTLLEAGSADTPADQTPVLERLYLNFQDLSEDLSEPDTRRVWMTLIESGWSLNGNYYGPTQIAEIAAGVPEQRKMFVDHLKPGQPKHERQFMAWAGTVLEHRVVTESTPAGTKTRLKAKVEIVDDELWKRVKRFPEEVGASVDVWAQVAEGEAEGRKGRIINKVTRYNSTDFVLFPAAGGKIERIAASYGWPTITESQSLSVWIREATDAGMDASDPKTIDAVIKRREMCRKWYDIKDALDTLLRQTANDEKLTDDQKKLAFGSLFDEFKSKAMDELDLMTVFSKNMMYANNNPAPSGEGVKPMSEIKTAADLRTAHPELVAQLLAEAKVEIVKEVKATFDAESQTKAKDDRIKALEAEVKNATDKLAEATKKIDEQEAANKLASHKALVEQKLVAAKLPEQAVTATFRTSLEAAKTEAEVDALIADRKTVVESVKKPTTEVPYRAKGTGPATETPTKTFEDAKSSLREQMIAS